jgi:hypothetical protein
LRIFVGKRTDEGLVRPEDKLADRLDRLRAPGLHVDERIAIFEAGDRHHASNVALAGIDEVGHARLVGDVHVGVVPAHADEGGIHLT